MAKLTRVHQKILGVNSSDNGQFGSAAEGTYVLSSDPENIMSLPAWEAGWNSAVISGERLPPLEERQGVDFVTTRQIAYVMQSGIPEWNIDTVYYKNSVVKIDLTGNLYISLTDDNQGNNPASEPTEWALMTEIALPYSVGDEATNLTTGTAKLTFRMPFSFFLTRMNINVNTAPVGSTIIADLNVNGVSAFSTRPSIDAGEKTSVTAATPAVISTNEIPYDAELTLDLDQVGSGTPGKGFKFILYGYRVWS